MPFLAVLIAWRWRAHDQIWLCQHCLIHHGFDFCFCQKLWRSCTPLCIIHAHPLGKTSRWWRWCWRCVAVAASHDGVPSSIWATECWVHRDIWITQPQPSVGPCFFQPRTTPWSWILLITSTAADHVTSARDPYYRHRHVLLLVAGRSAGATCSLCACVSYANAVAVCATMEAHAGSLLFGCQQHNLY